jgi:hypothetical protein
VGAQEATKVVVVLRIGGVAVRGRVGSPPRRSRLAGVGSVSTWMLSAWGCVGSRRAGDAAGGAEGR